MSIIMNVQLSVFCNSRIEPLPENVTLLMSEINNIGKYTFLPSVITGQNIDLISKQLKTVSNLTFISTDQLCQIVCLDNRLDVTINSHPKGAELDLLESIDFAKRAIKVILNKYNIFGSRLALNVNILSNVYEGAFPETVYGEKFYTPLDYYKGKEVNEWSTRINSRIPLNMGKSNELSNVITELAIVEEAGNGKKRVLCHVDINTLAENSGFRFNSENLDLFSAGATEVTLSIKKNIEDVSNHA